MSYKTSFSAAVLGSLSSILLAVPSALGGPSMPPNEYACQIRNQAGAESLVLVQAFELDEAVAVAGKSRLPIRGAGEAGLVEVVECINRKEGSFRDRSFQRSYQEAAL